MRVTKYEMIAKVLELGRITKAAEYYQYTQSALSQMIRTLEDEIGVPLLNRTRAGISLTTEGVQLIEHLQAVSDAQHRLADKVFRMQQLDTGFIRIGAFTSVACHWIPGLIKEYKKEYPNIDFELRHGDYQEVEDWVAAGMVDFGIVRMPCALDTYAIRKERILAVLPEDHPLAEAEVLPLDSLKDQPFIQLEHGKYDDTDRRLLQEMKPMIEYRVKEDYTIMSMVEQGLGVSVLPELVLLRSPFRVVTKVTSPALYRTLAIAVKDKKRVALAVQYFIERMIERYSIA